MKIIVIHGQNHKGSTWNVANILLQDITCEKEVKEFFLPKDLNHFCTGCYSCLEGRDKCPFWEDKKPIDDAIKAADLLILTTPNYCMMPSAPMKAFLDLFFTNWLAHKPYEEMSIEELQACILAKMAKNGPVTDEMRRTVDVNVHHGSLMNWVRSFN